MESTNGSADITATRLRDVGHMRRQSMTFVTVLPNIGASEAMTGKVQVVLMSNNKKDRSNYRYGTTAYKYYHIKHHVRLCMPCIFPRVQLLTIRTQVTPGPQKIVRKCR